MRHAQHAQRLASTGTSFFYGPSDDGLEEPRDQIAGFRYVVNVFGEGTAEPHHVGASIRDLDGLSSSERSEQSEGDVHRIEKAPRSLQATLVHHPVGEPCAGVAHRLAGTGSPQMVSKGDEHAVEDGRGLAPEEGLSLFGDHVEGRRATSPPSQAGRPGTAVRDEDIQVPANRRPGNPELIR